MHASRTIGHGTADSIVDFPGYIFEEPIGLYCVRNRWYDPGNGRWLSRDPSGYVDGSSLYEYCRGNPLKFVDPYGLFSRPSGGGQAAGEAAGEAVLEVAAEGVRAAEGVVQVAAVVATAGAVVEKGEVMVVGVAVDGVSQTPTGGESFPTRPAVSWLC